MEPVQRPPQRLWRKVRALLVEREGATAIEYAVIAGLISIALLTAAGPIGTRVGTLMDLVKAALTP
ncbi:Flp family type IVb pilin [Pseudomonas triclosanedens]|uniref:Flp family type IVb pilin n=1 Tax=Pseudomonas triclosanedens TaxID=2961893 RepID=UPI00266D1809|nr:Flp family type IVb pilin [Pseudomonas triclosanedens]